MHEASHSKVVFTRVSPELRAQIKAAAERDGLNVSAWNRMVIVQRLREEREKALVA